MAIVRTPVKSGPELSRLINSLNEQFNLEIPNPQFFSPGSNRDDSPRWRAYRGLKRLYYSRNIDLYRVLNDFEEWACSRNATDAVSILAARNRLAGDSRTIILHHEREERLAYLVKLIDDELYLLSKGSFPRLRDHSSPQEALPTESSDITTRTLKRRLSAGESSDEFQTAPNSPVKNSNAASSSSVDLIEFEDSREYNATTRDIVPDADGDRTSHVHKTAKIEDPPKREPSKFMERLTAPDGNVRRYDSVNPAQGGPNFSFSSPAGHPYALDSRHDRLGASFNSTGTFATEVIPDTGSTYEDSVVEHMISHEATLSRDISFIESSIGEPRYSYEGEIMGDLLQNGPFSIEQSLPSSVPLRYRYEIERIGRAWGIELKKMLVGNAISYEYDGFWKWIEGHSQRDGKVIPEKPSRRAWDGATGTFTTAKHSEAVVLTGELDWCNKSEEGVLKLRLNPLKTERTCRFHRRFGSDRFLSLTVPAPSRPPSHLRLPEQPALLRESIALWLTQNPHRCLGRVWKPFYVEEVKSKRKIKAEPRFRVEFFAIDGIDFNKNNLAPSLASSFASTPIAPKEESADSHTPMSLDSLIEWHMSWEANIEQSNLKLFQRLSLGLSKTFATAVLRPNQVLRLRDIPGRPVMNDGCALMSRKLANVICDSLGITGNTPSSFQGRIAGAKGLWMVDTHHSQLSADGDDVWIQISDSQLKIKPHPTDWKEPIDDEQLTFEVVRWSKPLHPVDLNIQLLSILGHGGHVKEYIADLARAGIRAVSRDFEEVLKYNSPILCRSLAQKLKPTADSGPSFMLQNVKRLEQWITDDVEAIVRFSEAGFAPQSFYPLRKRLGRCLRDLLERYVEEMRIEVPLSTYAFCIADPYGVLKEDEVHFGFSTNWRDDHGQFEDNLLDGVDVLVGRLPAHLPSDIQRRRAVWKQELRHFKDVIVFPTVGNVPLADMLSGGDYDGDTPWICWDQNMVRSFHNSKPLDDEESYPPEHFGLTKHSFPMKEIQSIDEFLQSSFTFNMTLSNLGRCTVEHEKLAYDGSIDSSSAKELSCLLSHLVDGRKGGVHLSEPAWQQYRKKISPRARQLPAYKNPERTYNPNHIVDYIRFEVASNERRAVLKQLERAYPEAENSRCRDEDLLRPWKEAREKADLDKHEDRSLDAALRKVARDIDDLYGQWTRSLSGGGGSFSPLALLAAEQARVIPPPTAGAHPQIQVWQYNQAAWLEVMASYAYKKQPHSSFVIHAFGETLCQMKARTLPSRSVTNEILACYRVNQKIIARLRMLEVVEDSESEGTNEYEGHEAIEAMLYGTQGLGGYYDPDDGLSVE